MGYTREDIIRIVQEQDVKFIRMQFVDVFGELKNVAVTVSQLEEAMDGRVMIDGSSIEGFVHINESDQYLHPDLDSFAIYPWRPSRGKVGRFLCDVYNADGDNESSLYIAQLANNELTYEKKHELNFGIDAGFLNNRITLHSISTAAATTTLLV